MKKSAEKFLSRYFTDVQWIRKEIRFLQTHAGAYSVVKANATEEECTAVDDLTPARALYRINIENHRRDYFLENIGKRYTELQAVEVFRADVGTEYNYTFEFFHQSGVLQYDLGYAHFASAKGYEILTQIFKDMTAEDVRQYLLSRCNETTYD